MNSDRSFHDPRFVLPAAWHRERQHFRAGFSDFATEIVTADSPGLTALRVEHFDHARADGPRWPLDPATTWTPSP